MATDAAFLGGADRLIHLQTVPVLAGLGPTHLAAIAQQAREEFFPQGSFLIQPKAPPEAFFVVIEGRVSVQRFGQRAGFVGAGEAAGLLHGLARVDRVVARAEADSLTLRLDWDTQLELWERHFPVLACYVGYLARGMLSELERRPDGRAPRSNGPVVDLALRRPLHAVERALALRAARAFPRRAVDALLELVHHVGEVRCDAGTTIWRAGDAADHFLAICAGSVRGVVRSSGEEFHRGPTAVIGLHETLAGSARWHDAEAATAVVALRVETEPFLDILEDHFDMALDFMAIMAGDLLQRLERSA